MVHDRSEGEAHRLVDEFARRMKFELDENFYKGDREAWSLYEPKEALQEIQYHLEKLEAGFFAENDEQIKEFAVDVANCAMILLDVMMLIEPAPSSDAKPPAPSEPKNIYSSNYSSIS